MEVGAEFLWGKDDFLRGLEIAVCRVGRGFGMNDLEKFFGFVSVFGTENWL